MSKPRKLPIIGSIILMVSLIVSSYAKFSMEPYMHPNWPTDPSGQIGHALLLIFFLFTAFLISRRCSPQEKKVYYGWIIMFLLQQVVFFLPRWPALLGNGMSIIVIGYSIYYAYQVLKATSPLKNIGNIG
jgi:hypothetical protein